MVKTKARMSFTPAPIKALLKESKKAKPAAKTRKRVNRPEQDAQILFFDHVRLREKQDARYGCIYSMPIEQKASVQRRAALARAGLRAGVPDIFCAIPHNGIPGLYIEMKIKPNKVSDAQKAMQDKLRSAGFRVHVAWSGAEAIDILEQYLGRL